MAMASLPPGVDPSQIPLAVNPNGDPPNFINPPSLAPAMLEVGVTLIIISRILVILRLVTNLKNTGKLGLNDCMCNTAFLIRRLRRKIINREID